MNGHRRSVLITVLLLTIPAGCATPRLLPVASPDAFISSDRRAASIEKEDILLQVSQGRNPAGAGSELVTFLLVARNTSDREVELLLDRAVLIDGLGTQYENLMVHELRVHGHLWLSSGWYGYYTWGWYDVSYPVAVTERPRLRDRNFPMSRYVILPHSQVRGCLFFPCRVKETTYVRLILTRLIKEKEEPGSRPDTVRATYRKLSYEYEFDVVTP